MTIFFVLHLSCGVTQNIKFDNQRVAIYRYPLRPLDKSFKTYSVKLLELNARLATDMRDSLKKALVLPGYEKVSADDDVQLELIVSPLVITNKDVKDQPIESDRDGKKTTVHQYWYEIRYSFPVKIRIANHAQTISELDLPGFFTTEYYPDDRTSQNSLQKAFDSDFYFIDKLKYKRVDELKYEVRRMLASEHGFGMADEFIDIGYVKDKKGEYADLTKAMSVVHEAFAYANGKQNYRDELFESRIKEASQIYDKALLESSNDKKARINPNVTGMIYYNLALASYGFNDLDKAVDLLNKIENADKSDASVYRRLREQIEDRRTRMIANNLLPGQPSMIEPSSPAKVSTPMQTSVAFRDYIIGKKGDTLDVEIVIPSGEVMLYGDSVWMQDKVNVLSEGKTVELNPAEIEGYSYKGVYRQSFSWVTDAHTIPFTIKYKFCKRMAQGTISVFNCYTVEPGFRDPTQMVVTTETWYKKGDVSNTSGFLNFNKGASKLVADYPELAERVKNGAYRREDFVKIVQEYNQWKKGKS